MSNDLIEQAARILDKKNSWNRSHNIEMESRVNEDIKQILENTFHSLNEDQIEENFEAINNKLLKEFKIIEEKYSLTEEQMEVHVNRCLNEFIGPLLGGLARAGLGLGKFAWKAGKGLITKGVEKGKALIGKGVDAAKEWAKKHPKIASALGGAAATVGGEQLAKSVVKPSEAEPKETPSTGTKSTTASTPSSKPSTPEVKSPEVKSTEAPKVSDAEKEIEKANKERAELAKKGIGTGTATKTFSQTMGGKDQPKDEYTAQAEKKYNEFVANRDKDLVSKLKSIASGSTK